MKKLFHSQIGAYVLAVVAIFILLGIFAYSFYKYSTGVNNLATQQQWASGKEEFDAAYQIAISDKDKPEKTIYAPNLVSNLGKTVDECVDSVGQGAKVVSNIPSASGTDFYIELTNESANAKGVSPKLIATTNSSGKIIKISFCASTWALGYPKLGFTDMINNESICEKTLNEAGLSVEVGSIKAPVDRSVYTTYASDMTTVVIQNYTFSGTNSVNNKKYNWEANVNYDFANANETGNLANTVRSITVTVSL